MKKIFTFGFFITSFLTLTLFISAIGAAPVAHADPVGTMDGSSCDFSGQGTGSGIMSGGVCVATSAYVSQSSPQTSAAPTGSSSGFTALAPIPGLTDPTSATSVINSRSLANFFNNLYKYLIGLAATLAVIMIIWGGLEISTKDSVSKHSDGKERITQAILGLILVLSPVLVFSIINPSILNLSLNLPPINLMTPPISAPPPPQSGCNDPSLTIEQQKACASAQKVIGTNPSSGAGSEDLKYYFGGGNEVYKQTLADQIKSCNDAGGTVSGDSLYRDKTSGQCTSAAEKYAQRNNYTGCKVLVNNTSVCFSK